MGDWPIPEPSEPGPDDPDNPNPPQEPGDYDHGSIPAKPPHPEGLNLELDKRVKAQ